MNLTITPSGTTSGSAVTSVSGPIVQGVESDTPPAIAVKGTAQPLSLTTASRLRVEVDDPEMSFTPSDHPWRDDLNYSGSIW